jgi:hypothetical protein
MVSRRTCAGLLVVGCGGHYLLSRPLQVTHLRCQASTVLRRFLGSTLALTGALSLLVCFVGTGFLIFGYLIGLHPVVKGGFLTFASGWVVSGALLAAARRLLSHAVAVS